MPRIVLRAPKTFEAGFARIRGELGVPDGFPGPVQAEAEAAAVDPSQSRLDARHLALVAIDPPGSTDLDQALAAERLGEGYRVFYAIADVGSFVAPGGTIDAEARQRGTTLYSPDGRAPLHPPVLSEDRASLLPVGDRPSLLWTIDLDGDGRPTDWRLERAVVRTAEAISYQEAQARIDAREVRRQAYRPESRAPFRRRRRRIPSSERVPSRADATGEVRGDGVATGVDANLVLLSEIGRLRQAREAERGGVSLNLPAQEVIEQQGTYTLALDRSLPVEGWNAQISLLTGMVAARTMVDAGVGVLRTLPPPQEPAVSELRRTASALGLDWPAELPYPDFVRPLAADSPANHAFLIQATRTLRGAGYAGFADGTAIPPQPEHGAIASVYAHVTAPLRRLVDRFANEILVALYADRQPPAWAVEALDELPSLMGRAGQRSSSLERATTDLVEAILLERSVGQVFEGAVVDIDSRRGRAEVQIARPAIVADIDGAGRSLAEEVSLRLTAVDVAERSVTFEPVQP